LQEEIINDNEAIYENTQLYARQSPRTRTHAHDARRKRFAEPEVETEPAECASTLEQL